MTATGVSFLWHMHQPLYRLAGERVATQPWVRLHASRSYYDMVRVLEEFPEVRVTFNLVPTLLDQAEAYAAGQSDLFREAARRPVEDQDDAGRRFLVDHFFSAQEERMIGALPRYAELLEARRAARRRRGESEAWRDFEVADLRDLQALFDLAWFGFKALEDFPEIAALRRRGRGFTGEDVVAIHAAQDAILGRLPGLYRAARERGQAEIAASPYAHPILPLLIDTDAAREAMPAAALPPRFRAPGDAARQIDEALARVGAAVGARPRGVWPSEGSLSDATVAALAQAGVAWAAGDVEVLRVSERDRTPDPYRPWRLESAGGDLLLVFRDHDLSDRIGFTYARRDPAAAAADLAQEVNARAGAVGGAFAILALDGENPWEHYPEAGAAFLRALYAGLGARGLEARTVSESLASAPEPGRLKSIRAGSWIDANFRIWIGGPEKNRAWALLGEARARLDRALRDPARPAAAKEAAWRALRAAEGSDWFWWLDNQFDSLYRDDFDLLFRGHLRQACEALGVPPPEALAWPIPAAPARPGSAPRRAAIVGDPIVDGYETDYFEWYGAETIEWDRLAPGATMQRARRPVESVRVGVSRAGDLCLRIDPPPSPGTGAFAGLEATLRAVTPGGDACEASVRLDAAGDLAEARPKSVRAAARKVFEMALPADAAGLQPGGSIVLFVRLRIGGETLVLREIEVLRPGTSGAGAAPAGEAGRGGAGGPGSGGAAPGGAPAGGGA